jgi:predicted ATP-grasp superfamily ATP-dependent carboligase
MEFVTWIHETVREKGFDWVLPVTDITTMLLAGERGRDGRQGILCAPVEAYERVTDKHALLDTAQRAGVLAPQTFAVDTLPELEAWLATAQFPVVLKPARSRVRIGDRIVDTSVCVARTFQEAVTYARAQRWLGVIPCLLQEYVAGYGAGVFALYSKGVPIAWFSHRRIREKPPQGGVSVLSESAAVDPSLRDAAERLLTEARWDGAAMVEFRVDGQGKPYLMEVNGRLWGSLQLAIDSGVDFPWLLWRAANGERVEPVTDYEIGRRLRWFMGDVDNLLLEVRGRGTARTPGQRAAALLHFAGSTFDPGAHNEILRSSDPRPAWLELRRWLTFRG